MALRVGLTTGLVVGLKTGANGDVVAPSWTEDATSGIALPQSNTEWNALISSAAVAAAAPTSIYLCQDALGSGQLTDVNGAFHLAQAGAGHGYRQAVANWSALAATLTAGTTGSWVNTDAALPDLSAASCLLYAIVSVPAAAPAATRNMFVLGTNAAIRQVITTGVLDCFSGAAATAGTADPRNRVMPIWLKVDQTGNVQKAYTDQETITPAFGAVTGKVCRLGSTAAALGVGFLYAARWDGANAELSDATIKAISQASGWTIPW